MQQSPPPKAAEQHAPGAPPADAKETPLPPKRPTGPLGELDELFMLAYRDQRAQAQATLPPVIVVFGSDLLLHRAGHEKETQAGIPDKYHALKAIAHTPFALYLRLVPEVDRPQGIRAAGLAELTRFPERIAAARTELSKWDFSADQLKRQTVILDRASHLLDSALREQHVTRHALEEFAAAMGPLMLQNTMEAGCLQVQQTHASVMKWKEELSFEEWNSLLVVNRGKHQARYRNAATQYFAWLLQERGTSWSYPGESDRVIYAEFLSKNEDAMDVAASVEVDADASQAFFGDRWRLSEDVLSDGAAACIAALPHH